MRVALGSDHVGYALKLEAMKYVESLGHDAVDFGCYSEAIADYPTYGERVGREVASGGCAAGVLICGTGVGISLAANRVEGVRAAVCSEAYTAEYSRRHNDANVIAFGARVVDAATARRIIGAFLSASFEGGRHTRRVRMIGEIGKRGGEHSIGSGDRE